MENTLPKHLCATLDNFLNDSLLTSWNVQSNSKVATITIRFKVDIVQDQGQEPVLDYSTKYKRVAESQQKRDKDRAQQWKDECHRSSDSTPIPNAILPSKQDTEVSSCHVEYTSTANIDSPLIPSTCAPVSARTRSRLDSIAANSQPMLSPVGQVDGPSDMRPTHWSTNPQAVGKAMESAPEWAKDMVTKLNERLSKWEKDADDFG